MAGPPSNDAPDVVGHNHVTLKIWTAGLKHVGAGGLSLCNAGHRKRKELKWYAQAANVRTSAPVHDTLFRECLEFSGFEMRPEDRVVQIDTRPFHDPDRAWSDINHLGLSGPVLLGVASDRRFGAWFFDQMQRLLDEARALPDGGCLHVVSFCRAGRHRSVAVAALIEGLVLRHTAWCVQVDHLASHDWEFRTCNLCGECRRPTAQNLLDANRARALADVAFCWALWQCAHPGSWG